MNDIQEAVTMAIIEAEIEDLSEQMHQLLVGEDEYEAAGRKAAEKLLERSRR